MSLRAGCLRAGCPADRQVGMRSNALRAVFLIVEFFSKAMKSMLTRSTAKACHPPRAVCHCSVSSGFVGLLCGFLFACAALAPAQSRPASAAEIEITASETRCWLSLTQEGRTLLFRRNDAGLFELITSLEQPARRFAVQGDDALAVLRTGELYRITSDRAPRRERRVPGGVPPFDLAAAPQRLYALLPASVVEALPTLASVTAPAADSSAEQASIAPPTRTDAALGVAVLRGSEWLRHSYAPPDVEPGGDVRLVCAAEHLVLAWLVDERIASARYDETAADWRPLPPVDLYGVSDIRLASVNGVPTLLAMRPDADNSEQVDAYRLMPGADAAFTWRHGTLRLSATPAGVTPRRYDTAIGFNQHLGVLVETSGPPLVLFGRFGEDPAEATIDVNQALATRINSDRIDGMLRAASYAVLLLVLILLFTLRRDSMIAAAQLPAGVELAFTYQRLVAFAVDFVPLSLLTSLILRVNWIDAAQSLMNWGLSPTPPAAPELFRALLWWAVTCAVHTLYAAICESMSGRTLGKRMMGISVLTERGRPLGAADAWLRNGLRLLELTPQFWVFAFLIVLSRNRQRLGDIFARTVVVRGRPRAAAGETANQSDDADAPG